MAQAMGYYMDCYQEEKSSLIRVKKFGGTSVGSIERIERVASRVVDDYERGLWPVVVASAMSGETNRLIQLGYQVNPQSRGSSYDMLLASGSRSPLHFYPWPSKREALRLSLSWPTR